MKIKTSHLTAFFCSVTLLAGCQDATINQESGKERTQTTLNQTAAICEQTARALEYMNSDALFQKPYVELDEWRDDPVRHRYINGGFEGTETRFSLYLPPEGQYEGRFFQYVTPVPMSEYVSQGATGEDDKISFSLESGAYFIETNGGGMKALREDSTIGAYRANAAVAQYSRTIAMDMYGCERPYGYIFGGSGGGFRSIGSMENTEGVWDGAVPYVIGSPMAMPNGFTVRMYALRVLEDKLPAVADAMDVGSDVDVRELLTDEEYAAFQEVTQMGFPKEAWYVHDKLDLHGYASLFPLVVAADPAYFEEDFWNLPGYEGHNPPQSLLDALVEQKATIKSLVFAENAEQSGLKASLVSENSRGLADDAWRSLVQHAAPDTPIAFQLDSVSEKELMGANLYINSGDAEGEQLLITRHADDFILVGSQDPTIVSRLQAGDEILIDNRNLLASQTYHRHQVPAEGYPVYDIYRDDNGQPLYPQRPVLLGPRIASGPTGSVPSGQFNGRMIVLSNLHDTEAYPWQGDWYWQAAKSHYGDEINNKTRLWYTDRAPHGDVSELQMPTQMVSYLGVLQQALRDLAAWVENGIEPPASSRYRLEGGQIVPAEEASERHGIQPVLQLRANGGERAEVSTGEAVELVAYVNVPEGTGTLVRAEWDFEEGGSFPMSVPTDELGEASVTLTTTHRYSEPGTYFVTLKVASQRDGEVNTPFTQIRNLARVRVIVE